MTDDPIFRPIAHAADVLRNDGHSEDRIAEALMTAGLSAVQQLGGARTLSRRLYLLAQTFAAEADRLEGITGAGADGTVN